MSDFVLLYTAVAAELGERAAISEAQTNDGSRACRSCRDKQAEPLVDGDT